MTVSRPILISSLNDTIIFQGITYEVINIPTGPSNIDFYSIDFNSIEKSVNEKVSGGVNISDAVNESFDSIVISQRNITKKPTIISLPFAYGTNGKNISINASIFSLSNPLSNKVIDLEIDGNRIDSQTTGENGEVTFTYYISDTLAVGDHNLKTIYEGDADHMNSTAASIL